MSIKVLIAATFLLLSVCTTQGLAAIEPKITFSLKALFKDRAMLEINGEQRLLSVGEVSPEGIKLISSNAHEANLICHEEEFTLYINQTAYVGSAEQVNPPAYNIPDKIVPGNTVAFSKKKVNDTIKYTLKTPYSNPTVMQDGQGAIWIGVGKELLRFDVKKEAWGVFDLSDNVNYRIDKLSVSDKSIIMNTTESIKNRRHYYLSLFDMRSRDFHTQLDGTPISYQFIEETLWFLDSQRGLGYVVPRKNNPNVSYNDALLYKEKPKKKLKDQDAVKTKNKKSKVKNEKGNVLSANGDDIWYSHHTRYKTKDRKNRLNEVCLSRYNKKHKTFSRFTRKEMGLDTKINCMYLAVSDDQVWVSHGRKNEGLSVFDTVSKKWKHIRTSANNMLVGGRKIILDNDKLIMLSNNQIIALNTKTLYADVILGDAVVTHPGQATFHAKDGYVWYALKERSTSNPVKFNFVLYKVPIDSAEETTKKLTKKSGLERNSL